MLKFVSASLLYFLPRVVEAAAYHGVGEARFISACHSAQKCKERLGTHPNTQTIIAYPDRAVRSIVGRHERGRAREREPERDRERGRVEPFWYSDSSSVVSPWFLASRAKRKGVQAARDCGCGLSSLKLQPPLLEWRQLCKPRFVVRGPRPGQDFVSSHLATFTAFVAMRPKHTCTRGNDRWNFTWEVERTHARGERGI